MKFVVLGGAGAMGRTTVADLAQSEIVKEVVIADFALDKAEELKRKLASEKIKTAFVDIKNKESLVEVLKGSAAVVNSTPYYFNLDVMDAAAAASTHYTDLGGLFHVTRKQLELDEKFRDRGLTAVLGMGAAPGTTNIMAASAAADLNTVESIDIYVGSVDFTTCDHPFYPPYLLDTIFDEYTEQPMVFENGEFVAKPPMSGEATVEFPEPVGRQKTIYTLHSEVATLPLSFKNKGIRRVSFNLALPEDFHNKMKFLVELGFGSKDLIMNGEGNPSLTPRQILNQMIQKIEVAGSDPDDCEVIRVDVTGMKDGRKSRIRVETTIYSHPEWKMSCGDLDTGVPPSIVAQMLASGVISKRGVLAPEKCVPPQPYFDELAKRTMIMRKISEHELATQGA